MNFRLARAEALTRRHFLKNCQLGIGGIALASLLDGEGQAAPSAEAEPLAVRPPHFAPKAKRVIYLHMAGSPPHLDLFDYKPELVKHDGELCPDEFVKGKRFAFTSGTPEADGHAAPLRPIRPGGRLDVGRYSAFDRGGRRAGRDPLDEYRSVQSRRRPS